jgi:hypothetical protein
VVAWFDGGGRVGVPRPPAVGRADGVRYLIRWFGDPRAADVQTTITAVNGEAGVLVREDGRLVCVIVPELADGRIVAVRTIANPDKLG